MKVDMRIRCARAHRAIPGTIQNMDTSVKRVYGTIPVAQ